MYRVTVEAAGGKHGVAVTVTDVDEAGAVVIDRPQPQVSRPLGASLFDEDEGVSGERWQWSRSEATWTDIAAATSQRRSPVPGRCGHVPACDGDLLRQIRSRQDGVCGELPPRGGQDAVQRGTRLPRPGQ